MKTFIFQFQHNPLTLYVLLDKNWFLCYNGCNKRKEIHMSIQKINESAGKINSPIKPTPKPSKIEAAVIEMLVSAINGYLDTVQSNHAKIRAQDIANERDVQEISRSEAIQGEAIADDEGSSGSGKVSTAGAGTSIATPTASAAAAAAGAAIATTGA